MRQDVLAQVARQLGVVMSKRVGAAVGLWGEPGIGKTHAAQIILERLPCHHLSLHITASQAQIAAALPRARGASAWTQAQLERLARGEPLEASAFVTTLVAVLGALAPFVLHFEDWHEASAERLEMMQSLARALTRTRGVGLLVTSRAELPAPFRSYRLEPFDQLESLALLESELKAQPPPEALDWVRERTRGNPLFTLEYIRHLRRQGFVWFDGERWRWRSPPAGFRPITIEALLEQFVQDTVNTPDLVMALSARAMLPPAADEALWRVVSGLSPQAFEAARDSLEHAGVLRDGDVPHPLYREVILRSFAPESRRSLARRALERLEDDPETAVAFVDAAELPGQDRLEWLERAAGVAEAHGRIGQAGRWLARAARDARGSQRAELALRAARHLSSVEPPEAVRLFELVLTEQPTSLPAIFGLANQQARMGNTAEMNRALERIPEGATDAATWLQSMLMLLFSQRDFRGIAQLWSQHPELHEHPDSATAYRVSFAFLELNEPQQAETLMLRAYQKPDLSPLEQMQLLTVRGLVRRLTGDLEAARTFLDGAVTWARLCGQANLASALNNRQIVLKGLGLYGPAAVDLKESIELYRQTGVSTAYASTLTSLGSMLTRLGQYEEAETKLLEAHNTLVRLSSSGFLRTTECRLCELYLIWQPPHGLGLARKYAKLALERSRQLEPRQRAEALMVASQVATASGQAEQGILLADECLQLERLSRVLRAAALAARAYALEMLARPAEALAALEQARAVSQEPNPGIELQIAALRGDTEAAQQNLEWFRERQLLGPIMVAQRRWPALAPSGDNAAAAPAEPSAAAQIQVLGPVQLELDGTNIPTRARKRLEILSYLLETRINGHGEASGLELIDALYSEMPEPEARKALKQLVYLNRSVLGADSIVSTPTGYALGNISSDAEDFLRTGNAALWRGPYLSGLSEGWRSGVREALTLALHNKAESLLEADPSEAARLAAILCEMEPLELEYLRLAVRGFERAGNALRAHTTYLEGRARLLELGERLPETPSDFLSV